MNAVARLRTFLGKTPASAAVANFKAWAPYNRLWHSLRNEPDFPVVVWAIARRT